MHRGTIFIIAKNDKNRFEVLKSTEFNGGMGLDCHGKEIYNMLKELKKSFLFAPMIREFDSKFFQYNDDVMTYTADEQNTPYIGEQGNEMFEYSQTENQFKFFKDDNGEYIYTSDSNYIKNLSNEDVNIVCSNGTYKLKPNQILVADYDECINNRKESFGYKTDEITELEDLENGKYIPTQKEKIILNNIIETLESFGFDVNVLSENGMDNGLEIEMWTNGGVDMIHTIYFFENYQDLYNVEKVDKEIQSLYENFSIDDEIDIYRQNESYKQHFTIRDSLEDFENYDKKLEELSENFLNKYHELVYEKYIKNEIEMEIV